MKIVMDSRTVSSLLAVLLLLGTVSSSAIPIWEMLSYEEKMGRLMYSFVHLVERYCKATPSQDCRKVMTLHGISNLLNYNEHTLDLLDPDQRNGSRLIWQAATKSQFKYPAEKSYDQDYRHEPDYADSNDEPHRVVVAAPKYMRRNFKKH